MLIAPGAGGSANSPTLTALADAIAATGVMVERTVPYRLTGRRRPDAPSGLETNVRDRTVAVTKRMGVGAEELVLGGGSVGGRICSQVVAGGLPSAGLAMASYPLLVPGRPERLRTSRVPVVDVPCLFVVSGSHDAFGSPSELLEAAEVIPGPVSHVWLEGGDRGLG